MTQIWLYSLVSVFIVSLISLVGILTIAVKKNYLKSVLLFLVSFAAGALLGDVFFHLFPELIHRNGFSLMTGSYILLGILLFFLLEKIMHWRHCHMMAAPGHVHPLAVMNLVGDAIHNFIDGVLIAGSYLVSMPVGIATTVAVIFHEIPQEMGDFGVLLHSGMKVKKALLFNLLSASTAILGVLFVLVINFDSNSLIDVIIPITIGGFLYIANTDLIPELHKDSRIVHSIFQFIGLIFGISIMALMLFLPGHDNLHNHDNLDNAGHSHMEEMMNVNK